MRDLPEASAINQPLNWRAALPAPSWLHPLSPNKHQALALGVMLSEVSELRDEQGGPGRAWDLLISPQSYPAP